MNKYLVFVLMLSLLLCSSCVTREGGGMRIIPSNDEELSQKRLLQIIEVIENKDLDGLKKLFSKRALNEAEDFDDRANELFNLIQGEIISYERRVFSSKQTTEEGKKNLLIEVYFEITTDKETYLFFSLDYAIDNIDPDNEGIYMIEFIKDKAKEQPLEDEILGGIYFK